MSLFAILEICNFDSLLYLKFVISIVVSLKKLHYLSYSYEGIIAKLKKDILINRRIITYIVVNKLVEIANEVSVLF